MRRKNPHVGIILWEELIERKWKISTLCNKAEVPRDIMAKVLNGFLPVDHQVADGLEKALGVDAKTWLNLQRIYDDYKKELTK